MKTAPTPWTRLVACSWIATACVDAEGLSEQAVTSIMTGDGTQQVEIRHAAELLIIECSGICGFVELTEDQLVSTCDVGLRESVTVDLGIDGGAAVVDVRGSQRLSRLDGGAYADGTVDVGGITTIGGGTTSFRRFRGRLSGDPDTPELWTLRTAIDVEPNTEPCVATYEVLPLDP